MCGPWFSVAQAQDACPQSYLPGSIEQSIRAATHIFVGTIGEVSYVLDGKELTVDVLAKEPPPGFPLGVIIELTVLETLYQTDAPLAGSIYLGLRGRADARLLERQREAGGTLIYFVRREVETVSLRDSPEERVRYHLASVGDLTVLPVSPLHKDAIVSAIAQMRRAPN